MIKLLCITILCLFSGATIAQQEIYEKVNDRMRNNTDSIFQTIDIPEKWKGESAVILASATDFEYRTPRHLKKVNYNVFIRKRILLLDKSAVNNYSEFSFGQLGSRSFGLDGLFLIINVIKPDGTVHHVNTSNAVRMSMSKNARETDRDGISKLAIPNLDVGDIIDYYHGSIQSAITSHGFSESRIEFDPVYKTLSENYPVLNGRISFLIGRQTYINISAANGAPQPIQEIRDNEKYFVINYSDIESASNDFWTFPFRQEPTIRFKVVYNANSFDVRNKSIMGQPEVAKTALSQTDYRRLLNQLSGLSQDSPYGYRDTWRFLRRFRIDKNMASLPENLFYYLRNKMYFDYAVYYGMRLPYGFMLDEFDFVTLFSVLLQKAEVEHAVFVGTKRSIGEYGDAVMEEDLVPGISLDVDGQTVYVFRPGPHSNFGEVNHLLLDTKTFGKQAFPVSMHDLYYDRIDWPDHLQSTINNSIMVMPHSSLTKTLCIHEKVAITGYLKRDYHRFFLLKSDYFDNEIEELKKIKKLTLKEKDHFSEIHKEFISNAKESAGDREADINEMLKQKYNIESLIVDSFQIVQSGRFHDKASLDYEIGFTTEELLHEVGGFLLLDVGKLAGNSIEISKRTRERMTDAVLDFPRTFIRDINIVVPEGYTVDGLEALNYHVENMVGGFSSTASFKNGSVFVELKRYYKKDFVPAKNWQDVLQIMDGYNNFTEQKLVFTKI